MLVSDVLNQEKPEYLSLEDFLTVLTSSLSDGKNPETVIKTFLALLNFKWVNYNSLPK